MSCYDRYPTRSALDLPIELAAERPMALRDEMARHRAAAALASAAGPGSPRTGAVHRVRRTIGRRLVELGSAIDPASLAGT